MNDLENFFWKKSDRCIYKWSSYFEFYDKYFKIFRQKKCKILEIGVCKGGSLQMWRDYFGKESLIVGMDVDQECISYTDEGIDIFIADQSNTDHLTKFVEKYGKFDIIIDDGSHLNSHQIKTFEFLYDYLNEGGIYLVEDTHTSYWDEYKDTNQTFTEFAKKIIDDLTAYHSRQNDSITKYTKNTSGIYFHDSMIFFEKSKDIINKPARIFSVGMKNN